MSDPEADDPVPKTLLTKPTEYQSTIPKKAFFAQIPIQKAQWQPRINLSSTPPRV